MKKGDLSFYVFMALAGYGLADLGIKLTEFLMIWLSEHVSIK
jgi:hypothetical protein